jgi:hypothetical protein
MKELTPADGADKQQTPFDAQTRSRLVANEINAQLLEEETGKRSRRAQEHLDAQKRSREIAHTINEQLLIAASTAHPSALPPCTEKPGAKPRVDLSMPC